MSTTLVLLAALAAGNWQCDEVNGMWECRAPDTRAPAATSPQINAAPPPPLEVDPAPTTPQTPPDPSPRQQPEPPSEPESPPADIMSGSEDAWVVQVGAFRQEEAAHREAERIGDDRVVIMATRRDGEDWYVLLLGGWPSRQQAEAAGREYEQRTGGSYWVRRGQAVQRLLRAD